MSYFAKFIQQFLYNRASLVNIEKMLDNEIFLQYLSERSKLKKFRETFWKADLKNN